MIITSIHIHTKSLGSWETVSFCIDLTFFLQHKPLWSLRVEPGRWQERGTPRVRSPALRGVRPAGFPNATGARDEVPVPRAVHRMK